MHYRQAIIDYVRANAQPPDKFSHQPRLYELARQLGAGKDYDDDVLYAAAWLHDIGVFIGHRPETPAALASWDNVAYAVREVPGLLRQFGFPEEKISLVPGVIETHLPSRTPTSLEGVLLRDADILEQMGAVGITRTLSKVGRDSRYVTFTDAIRVLQRNARELPGKLQLPEARRLAETRLRLMEQFFAALDTEGGKVQL